jgi:hypothetical protein
MVRVRVRRGEKGYSNLNSGKNSDAVDRHMRKPNTGL